MELPYADAEIGAVTAITAHDAKSSSARLLQNSDNQDSLDDVREYPIDVGLVTIDNSAIRQGCANRRHLNPGSWNVRRCGAAVEHLRPLPRILCACFVLSLSGANSYLLIASNLPFCRALRYCRVIKTKNLQSPIGALPRQPLRFVTQITFECDSTSGKATTTAASIKPILGSNSRIHP